SPISVLNDLGPRKTLRPRTPYVPRAFTTKASLFRYWAAIAPCPSFDRYGDLPVRSARWLPWPVRALSCPLIMFNGKPLLQATIEVRFQPPTKKLATLLAGFTGSCQTLEKLNT